MMTPEVSMTSSSAPCLPSCPCEPRRCQAGSCHRWRPPSPAAGAGWAAEQPPAPRYVQDAGGVRLWRGRNSRRDYGLEGVGGQELGQQVGDRRLEVARADALADLLGVEVAHQTRQAGLRDLQGHGPALDGADGLHGLLLRFGRREGCTRGQGCRPSWGCPAPSASRRTCSFAACWPPERLASISTCGAGSRWPRAQPARAGLSRPSSKRF